MSPWGAAVETQLCFLGVFLHIFPLNVACLFNTSLLQQPAHSARVGAVILVPIRALEMLMSALVILNKRGVFNAVVPINTL